MKRMLLLMTFVGVLVLPSGAFASEPATWYVNEVPQQLEGEIVSGTFDSYNKLGGWNVHCDVTQGNVGGYSYSEAAGSCKNLGGAYLAPPCEGFSASFLTEELIPSKEVEEEVIVATEVDTIGALELKFGKACPGLVEKAWLEGSFHGTWKNLTPSRGEIHMTATDKWGGTMEVTLVVEGYGGVPITIG